MVDERYAAKLLIGLSHYTCSDESSEKILRSSAMLCEDSYVAANDWFKDDLLHTQKRVRRPGKYSQVERETFRRERNRMHAKRTRDRKKMFFEMSEKTILNLENETNILRDYLVAINVISIAQAAVCEEYNRECRVTLMRLKKESLDGGHDDYNDDDSSRANDDDRWNGSNDGSNNSSSQDD